jgi:soluble lytic murein transglycosylase-like protein
LSSVAGCASEARPHVRSAQQARAVDLPAPSSASREPAQTPARAVPLQPAPLLEPSMTDEGPLPALSSEERARAAGVQRFVRTAAKKHRVDAHLINAVIWVESRFTPRARGKLGPRGLMQVMPRTARAMARELGRRYEPFSADFNIDAGTLYLARMLEQFEGDVALALAGYAAGPGTVRAARTAGEALPERTQLYVRRVLRAAKTFAERGLE